MLRMIAVLFAFAVGITIGLRHVVFAACFFIWNDIFRPTEWAHYHGILAQGTWYPTHITTGVLLLALIIRKWERRWNMAATVILVSLGWFFLCAITAPYKDIAMERTIMSAKYFIPLALISASLCTRRSQHWFIFTLAVSVGIWLAHHGLLALVRGGEPITNMGIPGGQMTERNDFLVAGTGCIPLLVFMGFHYEGKFQKWARLAFKIAAGLSVSAIVFSLSRGAILGFTALLVWYGALTGKIWKRVPLVAGLALVLVLVMPTVVWERMSTIEVGEEQSESSAVNRVEHMLTAVDVTLDYPLTGVGADNFPPVSLRYSVFDAEPHSLWLKCSSEYGIPMIVFFLLVLITFFVKLRRRAKLAQAVGDKTGEAMALALSCALLGFVATGTFTSQFLSEYMWAIIATIGAFLATPLQAKKVLEDTTPAEAEAVAAA